ncbi:hypothetical protein [Chryseobacterium taeanense]|uniref:hypothetical protein n=1 Tax=Chryseobacterium taeanense TaxID=311334 RepID=UPI0035ADF8C9
MKNLSKTEKELAIDKQTQKYLEEYYETLRKEAYNFSKKLEGKTAESETKEAFDNIEQKLDEEIPDTKLKKANFKISKKL